MTDLCLNCTKLKIKKYQKMLKKLDYIFNLYFSKLNNQVYIDPSSIAYLSSESICDSGSSAHI